jgi:hypothetical protein
MTADGIPPGLLDAYRTTRYLAGPAEAEAEARIGERSEAIDALLAARGASSGVFVTAWNPHSRARGEADNRAAHGALVLRLAAWRTLPHRGVSADGRWAEEGLFALDLPEDEALDAARAFGQVAVVAVRRGEAARLLLTGVPARPD